MARSTFSPGMFAALAASMAVRSRGLEFGSPPPMRAAMLISRMIRVKTRPRFASVAPFLCLIVAHFECPDMTDPLLFCVTHVAGSSMNEFSRPAAVSSKRGRFAAEDHADRFTVAKKNGASAETYGEPQTPVNRFAVALSSELPEFSTAAHPAKRVILRSDLQSPRKTAPVRRLTVNRKPLSTASRLHFHQNSPSLAQPPTLRNGLYSSLGHLLAFDRLPRHRQVSHRRLAVLPCL